MATIKSKAIDDCIATFPRATQKLLEQLRQTIRKAAPEAEEKISYGIPTFYMNGNLVHFSGYRNHIGFYPGPSGIANFKKELAAYKSAKGSIQFPLDKPLPLALITKIVKFRVGENKPKTKPDPFSLLSAPARRALDAAKIKTLNQLSKYSESEILRMHGIGPASLPILNSALRSEGLSFRKTKH